MRMVAVLRVAMARKVDDDRFIDLAIWAIHHTGIDAVVILGILFQRLGVTLRHRQQLRHVIEDVEDDARMRRDSASLEMVKQLKTFSFFTRKF
jgi:hypothetical protein